MKNKNYQKKLWIFLLMLFITFGFSSLRKPDIVFAEKRATVDSTNPTNYIYFDLAAGDITISNTTYTGYVYVAGEPTKVSDAHADTNQYYIYQSNLADKANTGYETTTYFEEKTNCRIPDYIRVQTENQSWSDYITNNIDVVAVRDNWNIAAAAAERTGTPNRITFSAGATYQVTLDNIWSTYQNGETNVSKEGRSTGGITAQLGDKTNTNIQLKLKGDNRFGNIHYHSKENKNNKIVFLNGDLETNPGSVTVVGYTNNSNHWCAAIGGNDYNYDKSDGIVIKGGVIYAGATKEDNCTAIGGGGNEYGRVTIDGGIVTAITSGTGTAIGGGIGYSGGGGNTDVIITGGDIYAYNLGLKKASGVDSFDDFVPAAAIGGGGSKNAAGSVRVNIDISGGNIYAQSMGGAAIGGGSSAYAAGGPANIKITGGTIIAKSIGGKFGTQDVSQGVSIGGGTGQTSGGSVKLEIGTDPSKKPILRTGSIGGGMSTGVGSPVGYAQVTIAGGDIVGQVIMAAGASDKCTFNMTDGIIHDVDVTKDYIITDLEDPNPDEPIKYKRTNGGAVFMNDTKGETTITGGTIKNCTAGNGGAIYMSGGQFTITNGEIINNKALGFSGDSTEIALGDGGGVYVGGGKVNMTGGNISSNTANNDGGGMYVGSGDVDVSSGTISNNTAGRNGGAAYVAGNYCMTGGDVLTNKATNGGGIYVNDGLVTIYGGRVDSNTAYESGGGMYISSATKDAYVDILSGSISGNQAKVGGGVSVVSDSDTRIYVTVGINCVHPDLNDGSYTPFTYPDDLGEAHTNHNTQVTHLGGLTHSSCPQVTNNVALNNGGGFFLKSPNTNLVFYCVIEDGNIANGSKQCYDMDVQGGHVEIGDKTYDYLKDDPVKGNIIMHDSIYVEGGKVDIYGAMDNPSFTSDIVVEIEKTGDYFNDHRRIQKTPQDTLVAYKVHYYENLKNAGSYTARQYPDESHEAAEDKSRYNFTVMASLFQNAGYKIVSWNTKPDGSGTTYEVNKTYNLEDLYKEGKVGADNFNGEHDDSLLVLYAIWQENGYVLVFNPNVKDGESYTGTMEEQRVTVGLLDGTQTISLNKFKRHGYMFTGWTLTSLPSASDKIYLDGEAITVDFTRDDGETIILYANWEICDHLGHLTYTANGGVLTEECSVCGGHEATVTIFAVDAVYDTKTHVATTTYSMSWLGTKPEITYLMAESEWDAKDDVRTEWQTNPTPIHAGTYTAQLTIGNATAMTKYIISPAQGETPAVPKIIFKVDASGNSVIEITEPTGLNTMYHITCFNQTANKEELLEHYPYYQENNQFSNIPFGFYYFFYAKKAETRDYLESLPSKSEAYLADGGNIVYINNATGIKVIASTGTGDFVYQVSADIGYHLRGYQDNLETAVTNRKAIEGATSKYAEGGITIARSEPSADTYQYTVHFDAEKVAYYQITLEFSGAAKDASVSHKVTDGEVFGGFNNKVVTISNDSAFTALFILNNYIGDEYSTQSLSFSTALPINTTIIMKVNGTTYWYYKLTTESITINLNEFIKMGASDNFIPDISSSTPQTITYQFIIDFSQVMVDNIIGNLKVTLKLTANTTHSAPNIPVDGSTHIALTLEPAATFNLSLKETNQKTAVLTGTYTESTGDASIWNGKKTALVVTAPENAPADLTLTAVINGNMTIYPMISNKKFIIPLGGITQKEVSLTINSNLFKTTLTNYQFNVEWFVSDSLADSSPLNGKSVKTCAFTVSGQKDSVTSIRIDGTKRICHAFETLTVTVNYSGIPIDATIRAYLQAKNTSGKYVDTALDKAISTMDGTSKQVSFDMGQMDKGSYRIYVIVQLNGKNIREVPYYFVIA